MLTILKSLFFLVVVAPVTFFTVVTPMSAENQYIFGLTSVGLAVLVSSLSKRHFVSVILIFITLVMSTRYMYFRVTQTLEFDSLIEALLGYMLLMAETYVYVVLFLCMFQLSWSLKRKIVPMPADPSTWPTVDVYIPTYNEPLKIVCDTVLAAQCLDYPRDKLKIYILDDGRRKELATFATEANVGYITRSDNAHAKAGNLNHAMKLTHGDLIAVFDCDHICTKIFLQATVGAFIKDPKLALIQTPHHFYSPDPIERNLYLGRDIPNEGELFYGPVQRGNDNWNATFFCGSCAVIRRKALKDTNGFAFETVTEDAHTALKLQRKGWNTAYLDQILAGGLATERLILHIIQRNRWARGMIQIFRLDNPLLGRGLTLPQRLCYLNAMMYFFFAIPRVIFMVIPLIYLLFGWSVIHGSAALLFSYALPHLILAYYTSSRLNGRYRYSFWGEVYDVLLSFHLVIPTILVLISPRHGKFNVTDKGATIEKGYFDAHAVRPHLIVASLLAFAIIFGPVKYLLPEYFEVQLSAVLLNVAWAAFNLSLLIAAICVARETPNQRQSQRLSLAAPVLIYQRSGICSRSTLRDLSMSGCRLDNVLSHDLLEEDPVTDIEFATTHSPVCVKVEIIGDSSESDFLRFRFTELPINTRREIVRLLFSRADTWVRPQHRKDNIIRSYFTILACIWDSLTKKRHEFEVNLERKVEPVDEGVA
ncbi:MAG: UDP-forming cellulose synthase catalytic subunit [Succinivibrionaceae bacterium]|nr:UDP-forming cellulose synthase catalytic subunit [Succinivibrionaceae bacterium]